jgi:glucosylceramidase
MGPHNGGCGTCTGLITVHNGDSLSGQVDYTVEYYDMGQLTKFVKPGAYRIDSTASSTVPNVAWINPDGSKALVAYNGSGSTQQLVVNWGNESFSYSLPSATSATFTWSGTQGSGNGGGGGTGPGPVTGYQGLCLDVRSANSADGTPVQVYTCNGTNAQTWKVVPDGTLQVLDNCMDVTNGATASGTAVQLHTCNGTPAQQWQAGPSGEIVNPASGLCLTDSSNGATNKTRLTIATCAGSTGQRWTLPSS